MNLERIGSNIAGLFLFYTPCYIVLLMFFPYMNSKEVTSLVIAILCVIIVNMYELCKKTEAELEKEQRVRQFTENYADTNYNLEVCDSSSNKTNNEVNSLDYYFPKQERTHFISKGESIIRQILSERRIKFICEYRFNDIFIEKSMSKYPYDFVLFGNDNKPQIVIEYQGQQHYEQSKDFHNSKSDLEYQISRDVLKKNFIKSKNITYIEIPYWVGYDYSSIERFLREANVLGFTNLDIKDDADCFKNEAGTEIEDYLVATRRDSAKWGDYTILSFVNDRIKLKLGDESIFETNVWYLESLITKEVEQELDCVYVSDESDDEEQWYLMSAYDLGCKVTTSDGFKGTILWRECVLDKVIALVKLANSILKTYDVKFLKLESIDIYIDDNGEYGYTMNTFENNKYISSTFNIDCRVKNKSGEHGRIVGRSMICPYICISVCMDNGLLGDYLADDLEIVN